jgi:hypothetical protein
VLTYETLKKKPKEWPSPTTGIVVLESPSGIFCMDMPYLELLNCCSLFYPIFGLYYILSFADKANIRAIASQWPAAMAKQAVATATSGISR